MKSMTRAKAIVAIASLVGVMAFVAPTATAAEADCPTAKVCLFKDWSYGTLLGYRTGGFSLENISDANNDKTSSWKNRSSTNARWYTGSDATGSCNSLNSGSSNSKMNVFTQNDKLSSWSGTRSCD